MEINPNIRTILNSSKILNKLSALSYLLAVYFNVAKATCFSDKLKAEVHSLGIFIVQKDGISWKVPLFHSQETNFEWVKDFRQLFKEKNKARAGDLRSCTVRMKEFFANNPHVRKDQVMKATENYLASVTDPSYLCTSHYFIVKGKGLDRVSMLESYIEEVLENDIQSSGVGQGINRMID